MLSFSEVIGFFRRNISEIRDGGAYVERSGKFLLRKYHLRNIEVEWWAPLQSGSRMVILCSNSALPEDLLPEMVEILTEVQSMWLRKLIDDGGYRRQE